MISFWGGKPPLIPIFLKSSHPPPPKKKKIILHMPLGSITQRKSFGHNWSCRLLYNIIIFAQTGHKELFRHFQKVLSFLSESGGCKHKLRPASNSHMKRETLGKENCGQSQTSRSSIMSIYTLQNKHKGWVIHLHVKIVLFISFIWKQIIEWFCWSMHLFCPHDMT